MCLYLFTRLFDCDSICLSVCLSPVLHIHFILSSRSVCLTSCFLFWDEVKKTFFFLKTKYIERTACTDGRQQNGRLNSPLYSSLSYLLYSPSFWSKPVGRSFILSSLEQQARCFENLNDALFDAMIVERIHEKNSHAWVPFWVPKNNSLII